jgi:triacylglycerol lipase
MSVLVSLKPETYRADGLDGFEAIPEFTLGNALAAMWLSQLAYEAEDHPETVDEVLPKFKLTKLKLGDRGPLERKASYIVASGRDATFVMFAGTDPLKPQDLITDIDLNPLSIDLHHGFRDAVLKVQREIEAAIIDNGVAGQPLFFTGHSMGGALALISAQLALKARLRATAVYTFGGPRAGGQDFFDGYDPDLGDRTFRLVYGEDIVAKVPPSFGGKYRHVGKFLHCTQGSFFRDGPLAQSSRNDPNLALASIPAVLGLLLSIPGIVAELLGSELDPRAFDKLRKLPDEVRDHIPASYFRALKMPLLP